MNIALKTIGIVVKDMAATLEFYRTVGLSMPPDIDATQPNVEVETPEGIVLGFLTEAMARQADPGYITPVGQSMNLQFECGSREEVDSVYSSVIAAGFASYAAPWNAFWGQRFARVIDPDGRVVNLYAD